MKTNRAEITAENIAKETYYNLVQLSRITGYADPISAIESTRQVITAQKDRCGNIVSATISAR